jgi:predicted ATP-dependent endonuclease of OLD family
MQIKSVKISNILSFPFHADISSAESLQFDSGLNIIIGENGAGKSTALEVINFLFKRVLYRQYNVNQDFFTRRSTITAHERSQILQPANNSSYSGFRLDPNWNSEELPQIIRLEIELDEIDVVNMRNLQAHLDKLHISTGSLTTRGPFAGRSFGKTYTIDVTLNRNNNEFSTAFVNGQHDFGYEYLSEYHYYKETIALHNLLNPADQIEGMYESFTLISSYRNYHAFQPAVSLRDALPAQQIQNVRVQDYSRSLNTSDTNEPPVFSLVRLRVAERHFDLMPDKLTQEECEEEANNLPFINAINDKLKVINLECKIKLIEMRTWQYAFNFFDVRRGKAITDINSLSAGQKAIIHLVFEAYGRGDLKGGVVIIDEPEIHLHYQFQHEYLKVIRDLNRDQNCQYILVTHSEALINSDTIRSVRRLSLSDIGSTQIFAPTLIEDQKTLIKILDNTRSTYAFFAKKVVLVEGDTDRYFFRSVLNARYPQLEQEAAVLFVGGKGNHPAWKALFELFGLRVYVISDFDYLANLHYPNERATPLKALADRQSFKQRNLDWEDKVNEEYANNTFVLKNGALEDYLGLPRKGLLEVIGFCETQLPTFLADDTNLYRNEVHAIIEAIVAA